jgi:hypothetical protein
MKKTCISLAFILFFSFIISDSSFGIMFTVTAQRIIIPYTTVSEKWWSGLAIHNESNAAHTYYVGFYDEDGTELFGKCVTIAPHAIDKNSLQNYASDPTEIKGAVSVYIRTTGASDEPFSATLFMGNTAETQGFGFETYRSQSIETSPYMCLE